MLISNGVDTRPPQPTPIDKVIVTYVPLQSRKGSIIVKRGVKLEPVVSQPVSQETEIDKILREQLGIVPIATPDVVLPYQPPQVTEPEPVIQESLTDKRNKLMLEIIKDLDNMIDNSAVCILSSIL